MDSSDENSLVLPEEWSPSQVSRLATHLNHYRNTSKRGWEAIATDILYLDSLPKRYVEREDTRPLSESLRRLATGKQTPNADRLNAVALFLFDKKHISARLFVSTNAGAALASAFNEFCGFQKVDDSFTDGLALAGDFEHRKQIELDDLEVWQTLSIESDDDVRLVRLVKETFKNPDFSLKLDASQLVRKRNQRGYEEYEGCLVVSPERHCLLISRQSNSYGDFRFFVLSGIDAPNNDVRSLLFLECEDIQFPVAAPPSDRRILGIKYGSLDEIAETGPRDRFAIFKEILNQEKSRNDKAGAINGA